MKLLDRDYLLVTLDFETYYGTGCSLSSLNTFGYITHHEFTIHGCGVKVESGPTCWYGTTEDVLDHIDEYNPNGLPIALLCHNTGFDGYILHHFNDWHPDLYLDTMSMSRGMFPVSSASLDKLAERLWPNDPKMRKGKELVQFRNVTTEQLYASEGMLKSMIGYCKQDIDLTHAAFLRMLPHYPDDELRLIELHIRMKCEPIMGIDVPRVQRCLDHAITERNALIAASGYAEATLSSNAKFERLIATLGIPVPMKDSPTATNGNGTPKQIAALGKSDEGFQGLRRDYPEHEALWRGRIAAKSVGEITRAERFILTAEQCDGLMPGCLNYFAAHTGRSGGCLSGDMQILVCASGKIYAKPISALQYDELVWDGEEFVTHGGVVFSGMQEVITHDGITATPDHIVFTTAGAEKPLLAAHQDGDHIATPRSPSQHDVDLATARYAGLVQMPHPSTLHMRGGNSDTRE